MPPSSQWYSLIVHSSFTINSGLHHVAPRPRGWLARQPLLTAAAPADRLPMAFREKLFVAAAQAADKAAKLGLHKDAGQDLAHILQTRRQVRALPPRCKNSTPMRARKHAHAPTPHHTRRPSGGRRRWSSAARSTSTPGRSGTSESARGAVVWPMRARMDSVGLPVLACLHELSLAEPPQAPTHMCTCARPPPTPHRRVAVIKPQLHKVRLFSLILGQKQEVTTTPQMLRWGGACVWVHAVTAAAKRLQASTFAGKHARDGTATATTTHTCTLNAQVHRGVRRSGRVPAPDARPPVELGRGVQDEGAHHAAVRAEGHDKQRSGISFRQKLRLCCFPCTP